MKIESMFCPKCAAKNEDDTKFCRGCGQDLGLVIRALEGHAPLVLASEIDKLFDRRNEGLLFTSIICLFSGGIGILALLLTFGLTNFGVLAFLGFYVLIGILTMAQYRRSLSLRSKMSNVEITTTSLYCPACGTQNQNENQLCFGCGTNLGEIRRSMSQAPGGSWSRVFNLEKESLRATLDQQGKQARTVFILGIFQALFGVLQVIGSGMNYWSYGLLSGTLFFIVAVPVFFLFTGFAFSIVGWRNIVADQRLASPGRSEGTGLATETEVLEAETQRQLTDPVNSEFDTAPLNGPGKQAAEID